MGVPFMMLLLMVYRQLSQIYPVNREIKEEKNVFYFKEWVQPQTLQVR